jgi:aspartate carbamoyltransferase catalytic subunit
VYLLARYGTRLIFVAPSELQMPEELTTELSQMGVEVSETGDLAAAMRESDVV